MRNKVKNVSMQGQAPSVPVQLIRQGENIVKRVTQMELRGMGNRAVFACGHAER